MLMLMSFFKFVEFRCTSLSRHQPDQRQNKGNIVLFKIQYLRRILCHFSCDSSNFSSDKPFDWIFTSEIFGHSLHVVPPHTFSHALLTPLDALTPNSHSTTTNYEEYRLHHGEDYISNQKDCCEKGNRDKG